MTDPGPPEGGVSSDFIFGTLATDELRLAQVRAAVAGIHHGSDVAPRDPSPNEPVRVRVTLGPQVQADRVTCYYTTDGTDPSGDRGEPIAGTAVAFERIQVDWDTLAVAAGSYDARFAPVVDEFVRNFNERDEVGASLCVTLAGETVVNV